MDFPFNRDDSINRNKAFVTSPKEAPCEGDMTAFITDKSQINIDQLDCCHVLFISALLFTSVNAVLKSGSASTLASRSKVRTLLMLGSTRASTLVSSP